MSGDELDDDARDEGSDAGAERIGHSGRRHAEPLPRGIEAFQAAATDLIGAARSMLDAAEDLVSDPKAAASVAHTFGSLVSGLGRFATAPGPERSRPGDDDDDDDGGGVRRIPVS